MPDEADETAKKCVCGLYCMCVSKRGNGERKRGRKGGEREGEEDRHTDIKTGRQTERKKEKTRRLRVKGAREGVREGQNKKLVCICIIFGVSV